MNDSAKRDATLRAHVQQAIAAAIRSMEGSAPRFACYARAAAEAKGIDSMSTYERNALGMLAAAAIDGVIWDATAQVRQVYMLERGDPDRPREPDAVLVAWICGGCSNDDIVGDSPGHSLEEIARIRGIVSATLEYAKLAGDDGSGSAVDMRHIAPNALVDLVHDWTGDHHETIMDRFDPNDPIGVAQELERLAARIRKGAVDDDLAPDPREIAASLPEEIRALMLRAALGERVVCSSLPVDDMLRCFGLIHAYSHERCKSGPTQAAFSRGNFTRRGRAVAAILAEGTVTRG